MYTLCYHTDILHGEDCIQYDHRGMSYCLQGACSNEKATYSTRSMLALCALSSSDRLHSLATMSASRMLTLCLLIRVKKLTHTKFLVNYAVMLNLQFRQDNFISCLIVWIPIITALLPCPSSCHVLQKFLLHLSMIVYLQVLLCDVSTRNTETSQSLVGLA